jgi:hypothetical protein
LATCERIGAPAFAVETACELAAVRYRQHARTRAGSCCSGPARTRSGWAWFPGWPGSRRCSTAAPVR